MKLFERELILPVPSSELSWLAYLGASIEKITSPEDQPIRFVITGKKKGSFQCEVGILSADTDESRPIVPNLFQFRRRDIETTENFNVVLLVPTGIGAKIGGDAGDAAPIARMVGAMCDTLITHPNVVNASDINELPSNGLYVEGSILTRMLMGTVGLQKTRTNRVLLVIDEHDDRFFSDSAINSASAARASLGLECTVVKMDPRICMETSYSTSGRAIGEVHKFERLVGVLDNYKDTFDAVAVSSLIHVPKKLQLNYFAEDMVNPWGGVEALLSHAISLIYEIPSAHSPMMVSREMLNSELGIVVPPKAAEAVSLTFLHCILKGLHTSPRIITTLGAVTHPNVFSVEDVSCLIIPDGCVGLPILAAVEQGIPVIAVKENSNNMKNNLLDLPFKPGKLLFAENYLEAIGIMGALKAGVSPQTARRPLHNTAVASN